MRKHSAIEEYLISLRDSGKLQEGFILSADQRERVEKVFLEQNIVKIKKKTMEDLANSVIKSKEGDLFVLLGFTNKVPQGVQSVMKIAQNVKTGEFCLVKIARIEDLNTDGYKKTEAERETVILRNYPKMFIGAQSRTTGSQTYQYKHYNFIKILPGVCFLESGINSAPAMQQCEVVLKILDALQKLNKNKLVHRDIHGENILVDPDTLEVNLIDFGLAVSVDVNGYWEGPSVSDIRGKGPTIRFANGTDVCALCELPFTDKTLQKIFKSLIPRCIGKRDARNYILEYNVVDLQPVIEAVINYRSSLTDSRYCCTLL